MKTKTPKSNNLSKHFDLTLLIPPLITVIGLLVIYYMKGIYPFGSGTTVDFDCTYKIVPEYFYLHDAWHSGSLFYDFTTAGGMARDLTLSLLRPGNIFMLLFPRDQIVNAMNYLLLFRMAIVAFTSSYSFRKLFPELSKPWVCIIALMYTFSGYNLEYFTYIEWLEAVAVFPLVALFTVEMFRGKSRLPFFFTLLYFILTDTYFSYFTIIGLIVFGGLYIFIVEDKDKHKRDVFNLGIGTLGAMLAGGYQIYLFLSTTFTTARFEMNPIQLNNDVAESASAVSDVSSVVQSISEASNSANGLLSILRHGFYVYNITFFMLLGTELAFVSLLLMWLRFKKHKEIRRPTVFLTISISLLVLQLFLLSTDLLWHGGSYACFPVRNGYLLAFLCCCSVGYYYSKLDMLDGIKVKADILKTLIPIFCIFSFVFIIPKLLVFKDLLGNDINIFNNSKFLSDSYIYPFSVLFLFFAAGYIGFKIIKNRQVRSVVTIALLSVYLGVITYSFIGEAANSGKANALSMIYSRANDVHTNVSVQPLSRTSNEDLSLIDNYAYVCATESASNWTATITSKQQKALKDLGYSTFQTHVTDAGATLFSKALFRTVVSFSKEPLNNILFSERLVSENDMHFYDNKYTLPLALTFNKKILEINPDDFNNTFEYQNALFNALNTDVHLFEEVSPFWFSFNSYKKDQVSFGNIVGNYDVMRTTEKLNIKGKKVLYLICNNSNVKINQLFVDGKILTTATGLSVQTAFSGFPQTYNNNVLELGVFENKNVELQFDFKEGSYKGINLYTLDLDALRTLCDSYEDNPYEVGVDWVNFSAFSENEGNIIFLPIAYDKEWKCSINGEVIEPVCILGDFIGLPARQGANEVKLHYSHRQGYIHIAAVIVMSVVAFVLMKLIENKEYLVPRFVYAFTKIAFTTLFSFVMTVLYVIPLIFAFVYL